MCGTRFVSRQTAQGLVSTAPFATLAVLTKYLGRVGQNVINWVRQGHDGVGAPRDLLCQKFSVSPTPTVLAQSSVGFGSWP